MNLKGKPHLEEQKKITQEKLTARIALLKEKGVDPQKVVKDAYIRKLRADIRKAGVRLSSIADLENLNSRKIQEKQEKAEAKKQAREAGKAKPAKEKAAKPEKKEKKPKKG
jgi:hypothetical protein